MTASYPNTIKSFTPKTDGIDDVLAADINAIQDEITAIETTLGTSPALVDAPHAHIETISATKTLTDADYPIQSFNPTAARDVILPAAASTNHLFAVWNRSATYSLTVKNSSATIVATVGPGTGALFFPDGANGWAVLNGGVREKLTANRTYYVRTDGNDSNTGLANTAGGAFLTIQYAIDVAASLDTSIYNITIQVADGTYITNTITCKNILGSGSVIIQGNTSTPANCIIDGGFFKDTPGTTYLTNGFKLIKSSGSATTAIIAYWGSKINFANLNFSTGFTYHLDSQFNGTITASGNYEISGGCSIHSRIVAGGSQLLNGRVVTLTGIPAITIFAYCENLSFGYYNGNTYIGTATGQRYQVVMNAVIFTNGGGANFLPGNSAGSYATGGQYV